MIITYRFRLKPTRAQHAALGVISESQRILYNAALEERISAYEKCRKSITKFDQFKSLTEIRTDKHFSQVAAVIQRATLTRVDEAMKGFFSRIRRGKTAGFPRFRPASRWCGFGFTAAPRLDGTRLYFKGMPSGLRLNLHRPVVGVVKTAFIKRDAKGWFVGFVTEVEAAEPVEGCDIGIDVGIEHLATLSNGEHIGNARPSRTRKAAQRKAQRALARCRRGSNRRKKVKARLARLHQRIADARATYLHQVSADLVTRFNTLYVENLNIVGLARGFLAREIHDAAWGRLLFYLTYKAERAGGEVIPVDPRYTSQTCSGCGMIAKKKLSERAHACACGTALQRDHNAAINILNKGQHLLPAGGSASVACKRSTLVQASSQEYQFENISN